MSAKTPLTNAEVDEQRTRTPGTEHVVHLNHAGSSLPPETVIDAQLAHLRLEAEIGGYEAAALAADDEKKVYASIATLIGAKPSEIARAEHATFAWNSAFWAVPMERGQRIVTAEAAYGANAVAFMRARERHGVDIHVVASDHTGQIDLDALDACLDDDVALVAITHVPTNGGLVNPAAEIGLRTRARGIPYLLDACQSVGQIDIDVDDIGCDMLSVTGRKFLRGPRGSGFLYVRESILPQLTTDHPDHHGAHWSAPDTYELMPDSQRFEYWEYNHAAWLGLGAAVHHANQLGIGRIEATVQERSIELSTALRHEGFPVFDLGDTPSGIVTTSCEGANAERVKRDLGEQGINVSVSGPSSTLWDATRRELPPLLRLSVHYITTTAEIERAVAALRVIRDAA